MAVMEVLHQDSKILVIGCRFGTDMLYLVGYGFKARNVRGLDMISYSPWIDLGNVHETEYSESVEISMDDYPRKSSYQDKATAESYFDKRFSHTRGQKENRATKLALERALDSIPEVRKILDIPCGSGRFTQFFCEKGYFYVGADISMEMMDVLARERESKEKEVSLVRCDAGELPFKEKAFDCVICIRFLNLVPAVVRTKVLKETRRISGSWLIVQSHHLKSMGPLVRLKLFIRKLIGRDLRKYQLHGEILNAGWREKGRVKVQHARHFVGIYQKSGEIGAGQ